jgi:hypothetical protein
MGISENVGFKQQVEDRGLHVGVGADSKVTAQMLNLGVY